jgi:hypothetical protein
MGTTLTQGPSGEDGTGASDDAGSTVGTNGDGDGSTGDGDGSTGDGSTGDGDGSGGDGDGTTGDGDGSTGDGSTGDGDGSSGDGDGTTTGDGDGTTTGDGDGTTTGDGDGTTTGDGDGDGTNQGCVRMDLVFIMDISASMSQENMNVAANFDAFIQVLDDHVAAPNGFMGYRVGVTSSSINGTVSGCTTTMGLDGSLHDGEGTFNSCGVAPAKWLDGPSPTMATDFECVASDPRPPGGGTDCGKEMPLNAIEMFGSKLAPGMDNTGFYDVSDQSLLVFVILTDEDEDAASPTNPAQTKAYLDGLAGGPDRYGVIVLAGPPPSGCSGAAGSANYATNLDAFVNTVNNGTIGAICDTDLAATLAQGLQDMVVTCQQLPEPQ